MGKVALEVSADEVHITGEKGAVTPGGTAVEITNLATGLVSKASAKADGSFDVQVDGSPNDAFTVKASSDGKSSTAVYVVRGGAAVGSGKGGSLSCEQRGQLAGNVFAQAASEADEQCMLDADCDVVPVLSTCQWECDYVVVSHAGKQVLDAATAAIDAGLCANYAGDGCGVFEVSCANDKPSPRCKAEKCIAASATSPLSCQERTQMATDMISAAVAAADVHCMVDSDCAIADTRNVCHGGCDLTVAASQAGAVSIAATIAGIDKGLCASFAQDGCTAFQPPCPAGPLQPSAVCMGHQCSLGELGTVDAGSPDAGTPDGGPSQACNPCLDQVLSWGQSGGLVAYVDRSSISCAHYSRMRTPSGDPTSIMLSCESDLVACNAVTSTGAVRAALEDADVTQALAMGSVLYGTDPRPSDGSVFEMKYGSQVIDVGGSCDGAPPNCIPPPAGVQRLVDVLQSIDRTFAADEPTCKGFAM